jgi:hypothetical protein
MWHCIVWWIGTNIGGCDCGMWHCVVWWIGTNIGGCDCGMWHCIVWWIGTNIGGCDCGMWHCIVWWIGANILYAFIFRVVKWAMQEEMAWIWDRACFLGFPFRPLAFPELYSWYCVHLVALCTAQRLDLWVFFHIRDFPPGNVWHLVYLLSTCTSPVLLHWLDSSCLGPPSLFLSPCLFLFEFCLYPED